MGNKTEVRESVEDGLFQSNCLETVETFEEMDLHKDLLASVVYDYIKPTLVQQRAIKPCINEHDVIIEAPSGSGKTTAVAISLLQLIKIQTKECQALVLVPDSKTALRFQGVMSVLGDFAPNFRCHVCDCERRLVEERRYYDMGVNVIVGTPADVLRFFAHDSRGQKEIRVAVLDGVDELLVGSCKSQVYEIFGSHLTECSKIIALSIALPKELLEFQDDFMNEAVQIVVKKDDFFTLKGVKQFYVNFDDEKKKLSLLKSLQNTFSSLRVLIFCNTRRNVDKLASQLEHSHKLVSSVHVESAAVREEVVKRFLVGSCNVLITSDYSDLDFGLPKSVVINYDLPQNPVLYSSRLGHNFGCARKLLVVNFVSNNTRCHLKNIEKFYNTGVAELPPDYSVFIEDLPVVKALPFLKGNSLSPSRTRTSAEMEVEDNVNGVEEGDAFSAKKRKKLSDDEIAANESTDKNSSPNANSSNQTECNNAFFERGHRDENHNQSKFYDLDDLKSENPHYESLLKSTNLKCKNFRYPDRQQITNDFSDLNFNPDLQLGLYFDFKKPLVVQQRALVWCLEGYDVLIEAPKGSGKTTTVIITILHVVRSLVDECQAIILVPSIELVEQSQKIMSDLSKHMVHLKWFAYGVTGMLDANDFPRDMQIVICTPTHLHTLIKNHQIAMDKVKIIALDEVEKIQFKTLNRQIQDILDMVPPEAQIILSTSASPDSFLTYPFSRQFIHVSINPETVLLHKAQHFYWIAENREMKFDVMKKLYDGYTSISNRPIVIYCNTYRQIYSLAEKLPGSQIELLKFMKTEDEFETLARNFAHKGKRVLITLDTFAETINFESVSFVINFDVPVQNENYFKRLQRSGKFKQIPIVISLLVEPEKPFLNTMTATHDVQFTEIKESNFGIVWNR